MIYPQHPCAVCGRTTVMRGDRCRVCVRLGRSATPLWCICDDPKGVPVDLLGSRMGGMWECETCHRPILRGE
jgi:hypothetical protein